MSVYIESIVEELMIAWEVGILTYDRGTKKTFTNWVTYHTSLHDFLPYGSFCEWCVHGKMACPVCREVALHLVKKGGKSSFFDLHRQFLLTDHAFRND
jgi:hypothetical protein